MNDVLGMAQRLEAAELDDEQREILRLVRGSEEEKIAVVNDILDFTLVDRTPPAGCYSGSRTTRPPRAASFSSSRS